VTLPEADGPTSNQLVDMLTNWKKVGVN